MPIHWIPLTAAPDYSRAVAEEAASLGADTIHFSHKLCHNADDLPRDPARAELFRDYRDVFFTRRLVETRPAFQPLEPLDKKVERLRTRCAEARNLLADTRLEGHPPHASRARHHPDWDAICDCLRPA
jgi:hypothetical protein